MRIARASEPGGGSHACCSRLPLGQIDLAELDYPGSGAGVRKRESGPRPPNATRVGRVMNATPVVFDAAPVVIQTAWRKQNPGADEAPIQPGNPRFDAAVRALEEERVERKSTQKDKWWFPIERPTPIYDGSGNLKSARGISASSTRAATILRVELDDPATVPPGAKPKPLGVKVYSRDIVGDTRPIVWISAANLKYLPIENREGRRVPTLCVFSFSADTEVATGSGTVHRRVSGWIRLDEVVKDKKQRARLKNTVRACSGCIDDYVEAAKTFLRPARSNPLVFRSYEEMSTKLESIKRKGDAIDRQLSLFVRPVQEIAARLEMQGAPAVPTADAQALALALDALAAFAEQQAKAPPGLGETARQYFRQKKGWEARATKRLEAVASSARALSRSATAVANGRAATLGALEREALGRALRRVAASREHWKDRDGDHYGDPAVTHSISGAECIRTLLHGLRVTGGEVDRRSLGRIRLTPRGKDAGLFWHYLPRPDGPVDPNDDRPHAKSAKSYCTLTANLSSRRLHLEQVALDVLPEGHAFYPATFRRPQAPHSAKGVWRVLFGPAPPEKKGKHEYAKEVGSALWIYGYCRVNTSGVKNAAHRKLLAKEKRWGWVPAIALRARGA